MPSGLPSETRLESDQGRVPEVSPQAVNDRIKVLRVDGKSDESRAGGGQCGGAERNHGFGGAKEDKYGAVGPAAESWHATGNQHDRGLAR